MEYTSAPGARCKINCVTFTGNQWKDVVSTATVCAYKLNNAR